MKKEVLFRLAKHITFLEDELKDILYASVLNFIFVSLCFCS